jgi:two-component system sensor histidine kinase/response regulator
MQNYLSKPIDREQLYAMIERWTVDRSQTPIPQTPASQAEGAAMDDDNSDPLDDRTAALARMDDDEEMYTSIMQSFLNRQANVAAQIRALVDAGDLVEARRTTHTLKGLAATVGAGPLHRTAFALEAALDRNQQPEAWPGMIDALGRDFLALQHAWTISQPIGQPTRQTTEQP